LAEPGALANFRSTIGTLQNRITLYFIIAVHQFLSFASISFLSTLLTADRTVLNCKHDVFFDGLGYFAYTIIRVPVHWKALPPGAYERRCVEEATAADWFPF